MLQKIIHDRIHAKWGEGFYLDKEGLRLQNRAVRILEFDKIIKEIKNFAVSDMGKEMLENLTPSEDFFEVQIRLKETGDAQRYIKRRGVPSIDGISNIEDSLKRTLIGSVLNLLEFIKIQDQMRVSRRLKDHTLRDDIKDPENVLENLISHLFLNHELEKKMDRIILNEDEVADHASPALYSIRRQISSLQESIKQKLNGIIQSERNQKYIQESLVTIRSGRYVIPVKQEFKNEIPGLIHDASSSGATIFIEPMAVVEANNKIREAKIKEDEEILRILKELTEDVKENVHEFRENQGILTKIDFILSKAKYAIRKNCICPTLNHDKKLNIMKGRHPLLNPESIVPIDFWIGEDFKTLIITGPNTGGKTVALKTVGLFVLMTQSGLFIPANEGTSMGVFQNVYVDIGDEQSIEQSLSTFSSHMKNIISLLDRASEKDLVLLDELGAGTDPQEGAALAIAILNHLIKTESITVATTHYSELKTFALTHKGVSNASCEFDVESLKPTYRLLIGIPGKSNAFAISQKLGLEESILEMAKEMMGKEELVFEDVMLNLEENLVKAREDRKKAEEILYESQKRENEIRFQTEKLEEKKKQIMEKAREKANNMLLGALRDVDGMIKEIKEDKSEKSHEERLNSARELKKTLFSRMKEVNFEDTKQERKENIDHGINNIKEFKTGQSVLIQNLNISATILSVNHKTKEAWVQAGVMKMNVRLSELKIAKQTEQPYPISRSGAKGVLKSKAQEIKTEIKFLGYTVDDAVMELDKYLDDVVLSGIKEVRIVHGKGTGALRTGIHQFLKTHPHVASFRLGTFGEGETGVTVVTVH
jgi:DNA mismatch repair protein MutS2